MNERKRYLSHTQLDMISKCGEMFYQRYVLGRKKPPGISLLVGRTVDDTSTENLGHKMTQKNLLPIEAVEDLAATSFSRNWDLSDILLTEEELKAGINLVKGQAKDKSIKLARLHAEKFAPVINPTHLQRRIVAEIDGFPYDLISYLDIQEGAQSIRDTKTSGKTPDKRIADQDDQLTFYAMGVYVSDGILVKNVHLDYLIQTESKTKGIQAKHQSFKSRRRKKDFNPILRRLEVASLALEKGVFVPARETDWWCDPKWCGYYPCKYVKGIRRR